MKKILSILSQIISHPLMMPLFAVYMIFHFGGIFSLLPSPIKSMVYVVVIIFFGLIPLFLTNILRRWGVVKGNWDLEPRSRVIPLVIAAVSFVFGNLILMRFPITLVLVEILISSVFALLFAAIVSWRYNISLSLLGLGWLTGTLISVAFQMNVNPMLWIGIAILWSGAKGTLELGQGTQTPPQILSGFVLGFMCPVISICIF